MKLKKLLIYSPYWHIRGGGERYLLSLADCLKDKYEISLAPLTDGNKQRLGEFLGIDVKDFAVFGRAPGKIDLLSFNSVIWVSDGSIPFIPINHRFLLIQAPLLSREALAWRGRVKLWGMTILCYSKFVKELMEVRYRVKSRVIYPPVEIGKLKPGKKDKLILTVGRFSSASQHKRPDILIKAFKKLVDDGLIGWRLAAVGITEDDNGRNMVIALRTLSRGYPIAIRENLPRGRLINLYKKAEFYWHAAGYGADLNKHPERAEHFGISTVEAMAAGAVPVVFAAGGPKEVVRPGKDGFWWQTLPELENQTLRLIQDDSLRERLANAGRERAKLFSKERFCQEIGRLFK